MGEEVDAQEFTPADRTRHREKVRRCLDVFARMLREAAFDTDDPMTGLEVELNLVDEAGDPALKNAEALAAIADPDFQTELGQFNIEINVPPAKLREGGLDVFEANLRRSLNDAETKSAAVGAHLVMIGILPTLAEGHMGIHSISASSRYKLLSEQILHARGEDLAIAITGTERLETTSDSILPEAACTSTQLHVQTSPDQFAAYWNASQAISAVQLAVGANSPFLLGKELWRETRIPLFEQATDTRSEELKAQGVRPRVWFGERWITTVFDLFEENVRYFSALLPITDDEDPLQVLEDGGTPSLSELRLHNGTIYRWNRPIYDINAGVPHLRVENRVLAAGPTVADTMANAAFYFGLVRALAESERPLWSQMSFSAAEENFHVAAQQGIDAQIYWPGWGRSARPSSCYAGCCRWPCRASTTGGSSARRRSDSSASSSSAACWAPTAPSGSCAGWGSARTSTASTRCAPRCWSTASTCTRTSPSTPGEAQGARSRCHALPTPLPGSRQQRRLTTTMASRVPSFGTCGTRCGGPRQVDVLLLSEIPPTGHPDQRGRAGTATAANHGLDHVAAQPVVEHVVGSGLERRRDQTRHTDVEHRGEHAPVLGPGVVEDGPPQQSLQGRRHRLPDLHVASLPDPRPGRATPPQGPARCPSEGVASNVPDMSTVVVGYVPKPEGEAALDKAIEEAKLRGAELIVVHSHRSRDVEIDPELGGARSKLEASGVSFDVRQLVRGFEAAEDLVSVAEANDAELIVIGLRRRTPVGKLILGSNAQRVLLDAHCPVLAVKSE